MEWWLIADDNKIMLPCPPSSYDINGENIENIINSQTLGEINIKGKNKLRHIAIESFFPNHEYYFIHGNYAGPWALTNIVESWKTGNKTIRLLITDTNINLYCTISEFTYGQHDGSGDVYYTLNLKEYKALDGGNTNNYYNPPAANYSLNKSAYKRPTSKPTSKPSSYVVKSGDTFTTIAKKIYGDTSKWRDIANKNNIKNPSSLKIGQKLVI